MLDPGIPKKLVVLEGETRYYHVNSERKRSPFRLQVETSQGQYTICASTRRERPSKRLCEACFSPEIQAAWRLRSRVSLLLLRGRSSILAPCKDVCEEPQELLLACRYRKFQCPWVYLSIHATTHTVIRVTVSFGANNEARTSWARSSPRSRTAGMEAQASLRLRQLRGNSYLLAELNREVRTEPSSPNRNNKGAQGSFQPR